MDLLLSLPRFSSAVRQQSLARDRDQDACSDNTTHYDFYNGRAGECERIVKGLPFCEQNAVLERLKIDVTVDVDGICSDWSFSDSNNNRVRLMEDWCSSAGAHHNAAMEFYTDGSLLVANGDSSQAPFDRGECGNIISCCVIHLLVRVALSFVVQHKDVSLFFVPSGRVVSCFWQTRMSRRFLVALWFGMRMKHPYLRRRFCGTMLPTTRWIDFR